MVLAGALLAGTAGCTFISQQATLIRYDPSDGIGATIGGLDVRNMIALINDDGHAVSLLVTIVNNDSSGQMLNLQYSSAGQKTSISKYVNGNSTASFGNAVGEKQIIILNPDTKAGALYPVYLQAGDDPGQQVLVPVLPADLPQYKELAPPAILK
ncbi:hypothetical protein BH11ACT4_BH11ACT4_23100 [soil metagenome]